VLALNTELFIFQFWTFSNDYGFWNLSGNISMILLAVVVVLSLRPVRRLSFELFKVSHLLIWAVSTSTELPGQDCCSTSRARAA
jgi:hypothetical protein